jgi:hypothetical protein
MTSLFDKIAAIFNSGRYTAPAPGGRPGDFYLKPEGEVAVKKAMASANLPTVYFTESNSPANIGGYQYLIPDGITTGTAGWLPGERQTQQAKNLGQEVFGKGLSYQGINYESTLEYSAKKYGSASDPLGLNHAGERVQYKKMPEIGLPVWYPQQTGGPEGMSGASIIFENGKPKKLITSQNVPFDIVGV